MIPTPTLALHTPRCGKRLFLLAALTGLTAFLSSSVAGAQPPQGRPVIVMTQNMNVGNLGTIRMATPQTLPAAIATFFTETVATNPKERAEAIAMKIKDSKPDLVALQEVGILRKGSLPTPNDPKIPATDVQHDQLQLLRGALSRLNEQYDTVAVIPNSDVQFPSTLGHVVRITDRTVILARASSNDLKLSNVQVEEFLAKPVVSTETLAAGAIMSASVLTGTFGWGSVDVDIRQRKFRFVATHLTPATPQMPQLIEIQKAQASELIQSAGKTDLPVVYAADFNTVFGLPTYEILIGNSGRVDAWLKKNPTVSCPEVNPPVVRPGCTCCQNPKLNNDTSELSHRIDLVIVSPSPSIGIEEVKLVNADPADRTSSGLWPSDHAGVVAILTFPNN
jgi:endonuclease/exonuclease/phosphatase family metal-dependent hydrolase